MGFSLTKSIQLWGYFPWLRKPPNGIISILTYIDHDEAFFHHHPSLFILIKPYVPRLFPKRSHFVGPFFHGWKPHLFFTMGNDREAIAVKPDTRTTGKCACSGRGRKVGEGGHKGFRGSINGRIIVESMGDYGGLLSWSGFHNVSHMKWGRKSGEIMVIVVLIIPK